MNNMTINPEQKVYVLPEGDGYSCLGFQVAFQRTRHIAAWLEQHGARGFTPNEQNIGTSDGYAEYERATSAASKICIERNIKCDAEMQAENPKITDALVRAYNARRRVRLFYGDTETGVAWDEENDVTGYVSRSGGWMPCFILVANARSNGGGGILVNSIVAIADIKNHRAQRNVMLYHHPHFYTGQWTQQPSAEAGYFDVLHDGEHWGREKTQERATHLCQFMMGIRMSK